MDNYDFRSQLERKIRSQEAKDRGCRFDKIISMRKFFYKTTGVKGSSYVVAPMRSSAIVNIKYENKYCFHWSVLAHPHLFENSQSIRVSTPTHKISMD